MSRLLTPCSGGDHIKPQDTQAYGSLKSQRYRTSCHCVFFPYPHEKLFEITWVLNPATRKDLDVRSWSVLVLIKNTRFVLDNGTYQTHEEYRGQNPVSKNSGAVRRKVHSVNPFTGNFCEPGRGRAWFAVPSCGDAASKRCKNTFQINLFFPWQSLQGMAVPDTVPVPIMCFWDQIWVTLYSRIRGKP